VDILTITNQTHMKRYLLLFSLCLCTILSTAQETSKNKFSHRVGLNFGGVTGFGPSYRYWPGKFGIQLTFLPIKISDDWQDPLHIREFYQSIFPFVENQRFISAGLGGMLTVKEKPKYRLVAYLGNHLLINNHKQIYNLGGGFGITFNYRVGFSFLLGYAGYDITENPATFPTAEIGIHVGISKN
jgi:hypothetical protein